MISLNWKRRPCSDQFVFTAISFDPTGREGIIVLSEMIDPDFEGDTVFFNIMRKRRTMSETQMIHNSQDSPL